MAKKKRRGRPSEGMRTRSGSDFAGSLLGKQIIVYGEKLHPRKPQRWRVPGGSLYTDTPAEVFRARVAPFSLDSIVIAAATLTGMRARDELRFVTTMRDAGGTRAWFHPTIVRRLVTQAIADRVLPDTADLVISADAFLGAEQALMDMISAADQFGDSNDVGDVWASAMRAAQHNARNHLGLDTWARELWLNRSVIERASALNIDLDQAYHNKFGITYSEMAILTMMAYIDITNANSHGFLHGDHWPWGLEVSGDPAIVNGFFKAMSLDYPRFQKLAADPMVGEDGFESYALSPLVRWPLVKLSDGRYVAPVVEDLLVRPTRGFAVDVQQAIDCPAQANAVQAEISSVYEEYVENLLRFALPKTTIHRGKDVLPTTGLNCDFVCVEGKLITLVEVKGGHIPLKADMTKDYDLLRREYDKRGIVKGLDQLNESARAIRERTTDFAKNSILTGLLVVRGDQVFMNSSQVRSLIDDPSDAATKRRRFLKHQIVNDEGLARLVDLAAVRGGLGVVLRKKLASVVDAQADIEDYAWPLLRGDHVPPPLHEQYRAAFVSLLTDFGIPVDQIFEAPFANRKRGQSEPTSDADAFRQQ